MDGHPCGDTRQNPGYVGSRPLPGPATSAGLVVSGGSWHAGVSSIGVSGIGVSGIGAYRPTHVPTPTLLQLANRVSHLLPTPTSHPASAQPSTDTHDSLSVGTTFYRHFSNPTPHHHNRHEPPSNQVTAGSEPCECGRMLRAAPNTPPRPGKSLQCKPEALPDRQPVLRFRKVMAWRVVGLHNAR